MGPHHFEDPLDRRDGHDRRSGEPTPKNGNGDWIRWAIGLTFGAVSLGLGGGIGFAMHSTGTQAAIQQKVDDEAKQSAEDRRQLREDLRLQFNMLQAEIQGLEQQLATRSSRDGATRPQMYLPGDVPGRTVDK